MKYARSVGLCVAAVLAIGAVAAATASANNPEYGRCLKTKEGGGTKYSTSDCTVVAEGESENYEWYPAFGGAKPLVKAEFTINLKASTIATLEAASGSKITCSGLSAIGEYTGNKTISVYQWDFSGCESGGIKCNTAGAGTGVVKFKELEGELGVISKGSPRTKDKIGDVLFPKGGTPLSQSELVEFACGGIVQKVKNSVIAPVTSNAMRLTETVKYVSIKGKQKPESFEGEPSMFLELKTAAAPYEQWGWNITEVLTNEEKIEIRSL